MNKKEAEAIFRADYLPAILEREAKSPTPGKIDGPLRHMVWNDFVDSLHKDGEIREWQAMNWLSPRWLKNKFRVVYIERDIPTDDPMVNHHWAMVEGLL
jgi:hypothetical protein